MHLPARISGLLSVVVALTGLFSCSPKNSADNSWLVEAGSTGLVFLDGKKFTWIRQGD